MAALVIVLSLALLPTPAALVPWQPKKSFMAHWKPLQANRFPMTPAPWNSYGFVNPVLNFARLDDGSEPAVRGGPEAASVSAFTQGHKHQLPATCAHRLSSKQVNTCETISPKNIMVTPNAQAMFESYKGGYASVVHGHGCAAQCREVSENPNLVSESYNFMYQHVPKSRSSTFILALQNCGALGMRHFNNDIAPEKLKDMLLVGGVRDPFDRFASSYEQFWYDNILKANKTSMRRLRACFYAHDNGRQAPYHCQHVRVQMRDGKVNHLGMPKDELKKEYDNEYDLMRNVAFSEFYDFPLDVSSVENTQKVLDAVELSMFGCHCWVDTDRCKMFYGQHSFVPQTFVSNRRFDFAIRAEHIDEDFSKLMHKLGVPTDSCKLPSHFIDHRYDQWGSKPESMRWVNRTTVKENLMSDKMLRERFCKMYMADALCHGYEESWSDMCIN